MLPLNEQIHKSLGNVSKWQDVKTEIILNGISSRGNKIDNKL